MVGVDVSSTGIKQLCEDAKKEDLNIEGVVADVKDYVPRNNLDVIVIDRTLHMLPVESDRIAVLNNMADFVSKEGHVLIADEKKNLPTMEEFFVQKDWVVTLSNKGFLFVQKSVWYRRIYRWIVLLK